MSCDSRRLSATPDVRASVHDEGLALLDISTGRVFLSNQTGSRIWRGIIEGLTVNDICEEISRDWGIDGESVRRHASSFVFELERRGLIVQRADS